MQKTKIFFDTEFTGLHKNTTLVSIGFVSECGKEFYAELTDYDKSQIDNWMQENVINKLLFNDFIYSGLIMTDTKNAFDIKADKNTLKGQLERWFQKFGEVEIISDHLSYDWVLFCDIFGHAFNIPKNVYYIPFDICDMFKERGIDPDISREKFAFGGVYTEMLQQKHNALHDAKIIKMCYEKLIKIRPHDEPQMGQ